MPTTFNDILYKFRSESFTQDDKGTQFERLMRSWRLSVPRYSNLTDVWLWEDFPCPKDSGGKDTKLEILVLRFLFAHGVMYWLYHSRLVQGFLCCQNAQGESSLSRHKDKAIYKENGKYLLNLAFQLRL